MYNKFGSEIVNIDNDTLKKYEDKRVCRTKTGSGKRQTNKPETIITTTQ